MVTALGIPGTEQKKGNSAGWMPFAAMMNCSRCSGLLVIEQDFEFPVWRCVQCGEMIDPVILRNRLYNNNKPT